MRTLVLLIACLTILAAPAQAERRVALVIGNSAYKASPLKNPANDARAMAAKLKTLGFQVIAREDATKLEMERAVADFGDALRQPDTVGLVFFAGHGMQVQGKNYLLPIDAQIATETRVRLEALDLDAILDEMAAAATRVNLVILDACRNNPFERKFRSAGGGLAQVNAPQGTLIAYATAPGKIAADGTGDHGLYTAKLLEAIGAPGLAIEEVFKRVRVEVARESANAQTPWESSSLTGNFYFTAPANTAAKPPSPPPSAAIAPAVVADKEVVFWQSVEDSTDPKMFEAYLAQFPDGTFAGLAEAKIRSLTRPAPPQQVAAARLPDPFDGLWSGTLACGPNSKAGWGPVNLNNRPLTVSGGKITGYREFSRPDGKRSYAKLTGMVSDDGRVDIGGVVGMPGQDLSLPIRMTGHIDGNRMKVSGIYAHRECSLDYTRE
ncbi:caspase domain-containing protein [Desertibaculum subflavum]|uniref:caspase domain-containing protein n=1 Tax=Desertibaculum subflavum TaxID=2268458 RepID=UPI0034D1698A